MSGKKQLKKAVNRIEISFLGWSIVARSLGVVIEQ